MTVSTPTLITWSILAFILGKFLGKFEQRSIDENLVPALKGMPKTAP